MFYKPRPIHVKDDFYAVEETNWIPVNRKGEVLSGNRIIKNVPVGAVGYPIINSLFLHRIVALTFLERETEEHSTVNHKDGNKLNNHVSNLEWCTYKDNVVHAYINGLRRDNVILQVKNLFTGEINEFYSLQECARNLNVNGSTIHHYLNRKDSSKPFKYKWSIIKKGDPWPDINMNFFNDKKVILIPEDYPNRKAIIFHSLQNAVYATNTSMEDAIETLSKNKDDRMFAGYLWFRLHETVNDNFKYEYRNKENKIIDIKVKRNPSPVIVTNLSNGNVSEYESLSAFSNEIGVKKDTVEKAIWRKNGFYRGFFIKYVNNTVKNKTVPSTQ